MILLTSQTSVLAKYRSRRNLDLLLLLYSAQLNSYSYGPPAPSFITYFWPGGLNPSEPYEKLTLLESRTTIEAGTTGMRTWRASLVLGEWLLEHPGIPR